MSNPAQLSFLRDLRRALYQLYDPAELRQNPLIELLPIGQEGDSSSSLRRLLLEAIAALKPDASVPAQSNAWRVYNVLSLRFAEQFSQHEVATDLALSIRQLRRHETLALSVLADYLWAHHDLATKMPAAADIWEATTSAGTPSREDELEWLKKSVPGEAVDVREVISAVVEIIAPLAQRSAVHVVASAAANLPHLAVRLMPMRQTLLGVLTAAIKAVPGGQVTVEAQRIGREICISVEPIVHLHEDAPMSQSSPLEQEKLTSEDLAMAEQLITLAGGTLQIVVGRRPGQPFVARLLFPATQQVDVLVVDDNVDTVRLLERYLASTRYHCLAISDAQQAVDLAEEFAPHAIILDVMLPGVDGWELLGRLHAHPRTHAIPVIVCTILPQEQLALTLGAAAFLRKPVQRTTLLATLDRLVA